MPARSSPRADFGSRPPPVRRRPTSGVGEVEAINVISMSEGFGMLWAWVVFDECAAEAVSRRVARIL
eukprot:4231424-Pyramimonas_sp.AAC.1